MEIFPVEMLSVPNQAFSFFTPPKARQPSLTYSIFAIYSIMQSI